MPRRNAARLIASYCLHSLLVTRSFHAAAAIGHTRLQYQYCHCLLSQHHSAFPPATATPIAARARLCHFCSGARYRPLIDLLAASVAMQRFTGTLPLCRRLSHTVAPLSSSALPAAALPAVPVCTRRLLTASRRSASSVHFASSALQPRRSFASEANKSNAAKGTTTANTTQPSQQQYCLLAGMMDVPPSVADCECACTVCQPMLTTRKRSPLPFPAPSSSTQPPFRATRSAHSTVGQPATR